jgi:hypothetical protein
VILRDVLSREFFHHLEDAINRARYEIDEKYHMGQADLRARFHIAAAMEQIRSLTDKPPTEKPTMPTIAEQIRAAKAQIDGARQGAASAVAETAQVAGLAAEEVKKLDKMNEELRAELAGLNGGEPL